MAKDWVSPNYGPRLCPLDMIVLHYTGMQSANEALERLCDPQAGVSAHYLIEQDGTLHRLVAPVSRAWHAGVSSWDGMSDVNSRSIGIELVNPGHEWGYEPFPKAQMNALMSLLGALCRAYHISPKNVWGHSDVAPLRKLDPGELFDWQSLARRGFGLWPRQGGKRVLVGDAQVLLHLIGYDVAQPAALEAAQQAFKRHFRPETLGQGWTSADTYKAQSLAALKRGIFLARRA